MAQYHGEFTTNDGSIKFKYKAESGQPPIIWDLVTDLSKRFEVHIVLQQNPLIPGGGPLVTITETIPPDTAHTSVDKG